jgi:hypothetical protein
VEFVGILPVLAIVMLALWQLLLFGMTFVFAGHAARAGARALAVGDPGVTTVAEKDLPTAWRSGTSVTDSTNGQGEGQVSVSVPMPFLFPGVINTPISIPSQAGTVIEDQLMPNENTFSMLSPAMTGQRAIVGLQLLSSPYFRYAPGNVPILDPTTGFLEAPRNAPLPVLEMIAAANEIRDFPYPPFEEHYDNQDLTYLWPAYDCSGATSFVLHAAGLIGSATNSTGRESWGVPGSSNWVTVWTNAGHAHIVIDGFNFDTAAGEGMPPNPPASGPRWTTDLTDLGSFQDRTWPGL